jgi:hypothetical protein
VDLAEQWGALPRPLEYYAEARGLEELGPELAAALPPRFARLSAALAEMIEEFGLLSFSVLDAAHLPSLAALVRLADKANGYVYGSSETSEIIERATAEYDVADAYEMYRRKEDPEV